MNQVSKPVPVNAAVVGSSKILAALHEVMSACGYVQKQGENKFHGYKYAGEANLLEVLRPAMVKAGLLLIPSHRTRSEIDQFGNICVEVEYTLAHKDGEVWPEKVVVFGMGNDKNKQGGVGDKGLYKALTGANKYLLFKLFQIETGDDPEVESQHDKDGAPVQMPDPTKVKNAPGVSAVKTWVREHLEFLTNCDGADSFIEALQHARVKWVKCCAIYPNVWTGADGSGLKGEGKRLATIFQCESDYSAFVVGVETEAKSVQQAAQ